MAAERAAPERADGKTGSAMPAASATTRSLARPGRPPARKC